MINLGLSFFVPSSCLGAFVASLPTADIALENPSPAAVGTWIIVFVALLAIVLVVAQLVFSAIQLFRRRPPIDAEFATKKELAAFAAAAGTSDTKLENRIEGLRLEIKSDLANLDKKMSDRSNGIHGRVDEILAAVSILTGRFDALKKAITS